jgi:hypothetical protein
VDYFVGAQWRRSGCGLQGLWREGVISDDAFHQIEEESDWAEAELENGHADETPVSRL